MADLPMVDSKGETTPGGFSQNAFLVHGGIESIDRVTGHADKHQLCFLLRDLVAVRLDPRDDRPIQWLRKVHGP